MDDLSDTVERLAGFITSKSVMRQSEAAAMEALRTGYR